MDIGEEPKELASNENKIEDNSINLELEEELTKIFEALLKF